MVVRRELSDHKKYTGNNNNYNKLFTNCNSIVWWFFLGGIRDPRQRLLAEQHQKQMSNKAGSTVPEKLSFKEKMKMFAMETGEDGTPKDKVKISKAQREIDNLGAPLTN